MRRISLAAFVITLVGCSQQPTNATEPNSAELPTKFNLDCSAPTQLGPNLTTNTKNGFKVRVNLSTKRFSVPWSRVAEPIKAIGPREIIFVDEYVERGVDNNPMQRQMRFDLPGGKLVYQDIYSALFPVKESFSARCEVVPRD